MKNLWLLIIFLFLSPSLHSMTAQELKAASFQENFPEYLINAVVCDKYIRVVMPDKSSWQSEKDFLEKFPSVSAQYKKLRSAMEKIDSSYVSTQVTSSEPKWYTCLLPKKIGMTCTMIALKDMPFLYEVGEPIIVYNVFNHPTFKDAEYIKSSKNYYSITQPNQ